MSAYHYTDSGLDNVYIEGIDVLSDDTGEDCITIPNVIGLHRAIATGIVFRPAAMSGRELRFLRSEMGMTQAEMANMLHREPLTISRWERGEVPLDGSAETVIRLHAVEKLGLGREHDVREIAGWCVQRAEMPTIVIDGSDPSNYRPKAA